MSPSLKPVFFVGDAAFVENEHPRDADGKFSSTPGGSGASVPHNPKGTNLNWQVAKVLSDHGLKKVKGTELPTFMSDNGVKFVIHPTPGQKSSSKFSATEPGGAVHHNQGHNTLKSLIKSITNHVDKSMVQAAPAPKIDVPKVAPKVEMKEAPAPGSFKGKASLADQTLAKGGLETFSDNYGYINEENLDPDWTSYKNKDTGISFSFKTGDGAGGEWAIFVPGQFGAAQTGVGYSAFTSKMAQIGAMEAIQEPKPKQKSGEELASLMTSFAKTGGNALLSNNGYAIEELDSNGETLTYSKPNGAAVQYNTKTDEWVAATPGHLTKEGTGVENLGKLLSGKAPTIAPGGKAPWQNSSKTIQTKQQAEVAKVQAEAAAAKQKAANKSHSMYTKMKESAPKPTVEQRQALSSYSGSNYKNMNNKLRAGQGKDDTHIKHLTEYLLNAKISETVTLSRGVDDNFGAAFLSLATVGGIMEEKGFMSTSANANWGWGSVRMTVHVPKGVAGAAIGNYSQHSSEGEVLLAPGRHFYVNALDLKSKTATVTILTDEQVEQVKAFKLAMGKTE